MRLILLTAFLSIALFGRATNYYFSASAGDDSRSAQEAQNPNTPWKSLQKLNAFSSSLQPGDTVFFKSGDVFEGKFALTKSGTAGNPVVFTSYGDGAKPVISGLTSLPSFTWYSGNIYVHPLNAVRPGILLVNNVQQPYGRYPNSSDANGGFLNIDSHDGTTSIADQDINGSTNWTGGEVVIRKNRWIIDHSPITNQQGHNLYYANTSQYEPTNNFGYFIQNHIRTLDKDGEWSFDARQKKLYLYKSDFTSSTEVKVSVVDTLFYINNQSFVSINGLQFKGANETALLITYAKNISITNCDILYSNLNGVLLNYASDILIENCTFNYSNNNAITTMLNCRNFRIRNNTITNTGIYPGMGKSGDLSYQAITLKGKNNLVEFNKIDNTGYIPIRFEGDSVIIRNNVISNFAFLKDDGAGIYTWNNDARAPDNIYRVVKDNIVINGQGAGLGTSAPGEAHAHGIYLDDNAANVEISGNTVANCAEAGVYIHNARNTTIRDNTLFNNDRQLYLQHDVATSNAPIRNLQVKNNVLYAKTASQQLLRIKTAKDDISSFGDADSNYYERPLNPEPSIYTSYTRNYNELIQTYDLSSWQGAFQKDLNSKTAPIQLQKYKNNGLVGSNRIANSTFDNNIYSAYGYFYSGSFAMQWNSGGKLDGGCLQATFDMSTTNNRGLVIMDVGNVVAGRTYLLKFSLLGKSNNKSLTLYLRKTASPYTRISDYSFCKVINQRSENEFLFIPNETVSGASIVFDISDQNTLWMDNVKFQEANVSIPNPNDYIRFEYNATPNRKTVALDGPYVDAKNNSYTGTISLDPFKSVVLFRTQAGVKSDQGISFAPISDKTYSDAPFNLNATASSGLPISYRIVSGPATISGNTVTITGVGAVTIEASQPGNTSYNAAVPVQQSFAVAKGKQTINFPDIPNKTFGDAPFALNATASSGLPVSYRILSGPAILSGNILTITGTGEVWVEASQAGNSNYQWANATSQNFLVGASVTAVKINQTIAFPALSNKTYGDESFTLSATASSGLSVSYRVVSGPAIITDGTVTITGTGTVTIEASQAGNDNYNAAVAVTQTFKIAKATQSINFNAIANKTIGDASFSLKATASSGLPVSFRVVSGPASIVDNLVVITGAGDVSIEASQSGNTNYNAAATVTQSFSVLKASQTISFDTPDDKTIGDAPFELDATASSGLPVSFRVVSGPASIVDNLVVITGAGDVSIEASQAGDANYNAAASVLRSFTVMDKVVNKYDQAISFASLPDRTFGDAPFALTATTSSGLPVSFRVVSGPASIDVNNMVLLTGVGTVVIEASQAGDEDYDAAEPVQQSFSVVAPANNGKQSQTISFGTLAYQTYNSPSFTISATATSGLPVNFKVISGPATISPDNVVTITDIGFVTIEADQNGNDSYYAAPPVQRSFTVGKAGQFITFPALLNKTIDDVPFALTATSSSGLPVNYRVVSGPATVSGNLVSITGTGIVTIEASQPGNDYYSPSFVLTRSFIVVSNNQGKSPQVISFPSIDDQTYGDASFALNATASSGLPVSYRVVYGPATITDNIVTLTGTGAVAIEASQSGNRDYRRAPVVVQNFTVNKADQAISFANLNSMTYGDAPVALNAAASSGLPVNYRVVSGPAVISGNILSITGAGDVVIEASQPGDSNYNAADTVTKSFSVAKASQAINIGTLPYQVYSNQPFTLSATSTSGLPVYFRLVSGPVTITANSVNMLGVGFVTVEAFQPGSDNYLPAQAVQRSFAIGKAGQVINFPLSGSKTTDDRPFALTATSSSGLPVAYRLVSGPAVLIDNFVTITGAGVVIIEASQAGDENYVAAFPLQRSFVVTRPTNSLQPDSEQTQTNDTSSTIATNQSTIARRTAKIEAVTETENKLSIYPNPVTANASVSVTVAQTDAGVVEIYDIQGRLVKLFERREFEKGKTTTLLLDATGLTSGTYFIRLKVNGKIFSNRFLVIKR